MAGDVEKKNLDLMQTLDDAWNAQDWDTYATRIVEENLFYDRVGMMKQLGIG